MDYQYFYDRKGAGQEICPAPFDILVVTFVLLDGSVTHGDF